MKATLLDKSTGKFLLHEINLDEIKWQLVITEIEFEKLQKQQKNLNNFLRSLYRFINYPNYKDNNFVITQDIRKLTVSGISKSEIQQWKKSLLLINEDNPTYADHISKLIQLVDEFIMEFENNTISTNETPNTNSEIKQELDFFNDDLTNLLDTFDYSQNQAETFHKIKDIGQQITALGLNGLDLLESKKLTGDLFSAKEMESDHAHF